MNKLTASAVLFASAPLAVVMGAGILHGAPASAVTPSAPVTSTVVSHSTKPLLKLPRWTRVACKGEGTNNCVWNAQTMGNGLGHSYIVRELPGGKMACIFYVERSFAATNDYCSRNLA